MSIASRQKRKQREIRLRKEKHLIQAREAYPKFIFVNEGVVSPEFARGVREAVRKIDLGRVRFEYQNQLAHFYLRGLAKDGHQVAVPETMHKITEMSGIGLTPKQIIRAGAVGGKVLSRFAGLFASVHSLMVGQIREMIFRQDSTRFLGWFPEMGFRVCTVGRDLAVVFQRVHCVEGGKGKLWEFMIPQHVQFGPRKYRVAYTRHAWERISQRFIRQLPGQEAYPGHDFFLLGKLRPIAISGQRLIQYYYPVQIGSNQAPWPGEVEGVDYPTIDGRECKSAISFVYAKAFCAPIGFDGDRVVLTTALSVGYHPTPESALLGNPPEDKAEEAATIRHDFVGDICLRSPEYMRGIHFFHANGIPQVFQEPAPASSQENLVMGHYQTVRQLPDFVESAN